MWCPAKKWWHYPPPHCIALGLPPPRACMGRQAYTDVRTKISRIDRLTNFLTHGALLCGLWPQRNSAINCHISGHTKFPTNLGLLTNFPLACSCKPMLWSKIPWTKISCWSHIQKLKRRLKLHTTILRRTCKFFNLRKTNGIPPLIAFVPSKTAFSLFRKKIISNKLLKVLNKWSKLKSKIRVLQQQQFHHVNFI